jgi:hypothetical protein
MHDHLFFHEYHVILMTCNRLMVFSGRGTLLECGNKCRGPVLRQVIPRTAGTWGVRWLVVQCGKPATCLPSVPQSQPEPASCSGHKLNRLPSSCKVLRYEPFYRS